MPNPALPFQGTALADPIGVNELRRPVAEPEPNRAGGETEPRREARTASTACRVGRRSDTPGEGGVLDSWEPGNLAT